MSTEVEPWELPLLELEDCEPVATPDPWDQVLRVGEVPLKFQAWL